MSLQRMRIPVGKQSALTVDNTAAGISLTVPTDKHPNGALISVFTAPIRFWVNGDAPTASTGHRADVYDEIALDDASAIANFKAIRESGVSANLEITYFA